MPEHKRTILLVEDNDGDAVLAREALIYNRSDTCLIHVKCADSALEYLSDKETPVPDMILLDLNLPGINGQELLKILKNRSDTRYIPVVILSTSSNENDVRSCSELDAHSYITKPIDLLDFFNVFSRIDDVLTKCMSGGESNE